MVQIAQPYLLDDEITDSCTHFLEQVKLLLPFDALSVVLLDSDQDTSRVAFSWKSTTGQVTQPPDPQTSPSLPGAAEVAENSTIKLPIKGVDNLLGWILIRTSHRSDFALYEHRLVGDILNILAVRLENIQLRQRIQATKREMDLVDEIARIVTLANNIDDVYFKFAEAVQKIVAFERISINVINPETEEFTVKYLYGPTFLGRRPGDSAPLAGTTTGYLWRTGKTIIRSHTSTGPILKIDNFLAQLGFKSVISVPLMTNGVVVGALALHSKEAKLYGDREQTILERIASQIASAVESSRLHQKMQATDQEIALVDEIARIVTSADNIDDVYLQFADAVQKTVAFDRISVNIINQETKEFTANYVVGPILPGMRPGELTPLENSSTGLLWLTGETIIRGDVSTEPRFKIDHSLARLGFKSIINVPLIANRVVVGALALNSRQANAFGAREQVILERFASQIAPAIERVNRQKRIQADAVRTEVLREVSTVLGSVNNLEDLFNRLSNCLSEAIGFDQAILSWITSSQPDSRIDTLQTIKNPDSPGQVAGVAGNASQCSRLTTPLSDHGAIIGSLELRRESLPFNPEEQRLMHLIGNHIAPVVYNIGLQQITVRQAYQLRQRIEVAARHQESLCDDMTQYAEPLVDLAHALYSPLTAIKGYTGSLLQPNADWPEEVRQDFLKTINQAADRLNQAIKDLVLPTQQQSPSQVATQPETRVQEIFKRLELELSGSVTAIDITFICDPKLPPVIIDQGVVKSVIRHMIDCATASTSYPAELRVLAVADQQSVTISLEFADQSAPPSWDTNLRVVVCRKLLKSVGTTLNVETLAADAVRLWFQTPVAQESIGGKAGLPQS